MFGAYVIMTCFHIFYFGMAIYPQYPSDGTQRLKKLVTSIFFFGEIFFLFFLGMCRLLLQKVWCWWLIRVDRARLRFGDETVCDERDAVPSPAFIILTIFTIWFMVASRLLKLSVIETFIYWNSSCIWRRSVIFISSMNSWLLPIYFYFFEK